MMKIYLYLKHFPAMGTPLIGGTTKAVHGLATGLVACGAIVNVLCEGNATSESPTPAGYKILCFKNTQKRVPFSVSKELKYYLMEPANKPSLTVLNGSFHPPVATLSRILYRRGMPYVIAPHTAYVPTLFAEKPYFKWPFWYLREKPLLERAAAIQLLDERHAQYLYRLGLTNKVIEVPNGFNSAELIEQSNKPRDQESIAQLFFFGRIDMKQKGLDILLHALARLEDTRDFHLTIQGPDWRGDQHKLSVMAKALSLTERVSFLESDYSTPPSEILSRYDVLCMPSRQEGFGLSALETMMAGKVLLVSEVNGVAPHVRASNCGVVVQPEVDSVVRALETLLDRRSEWPEMGSRGRQYALDNLDWRKIAAHALDEYGELVS